MDAWTDIERFMKTSGPVELDDLEWDRVQDYPLSPEALRTLRYFMHTESATFFYLRTLMATDAVIDEPEMAPFLAVWTYEEEYHGRAFRRFAEAAGEQVDDEYRNAMFGGRGAGERIDELGQRVLGMLLPREWPAVHMVWGAIQELTTYTAYRQLAQRSGHPVLQELCSRIMKQEARHFAFYQHHARRRLAASARTRWVTRAALALGWTPVGDGMCAREDSVHAIRYLFDGYEGDAIAGIERRVRQLPGLEGFDMFTRYARRHDIRRAPASWFPEGVALAAE